MAFSRMKPDQLAATKTGADTANHFRRLAIAANGLGVTSVERRKAQAELDRALPARQVKKLKEDALRQAGARPKGIVGRIFG